MIYFASLTLQKFQSDLIFRIKRIKYVGLGGRADLGVLEKMLRVCLVAKGIEVGKWNVRKVVVFWEFRYILGPTIFFLHLTLLLGPTNFIFHHYLYFPYFTPIPISNSNSNSITSILSIQTGPKSYLRLRARLVDRKVYNGNGNGIECKGVKMESRGKLGNDVM